MNVPTGPITDAQARAVEAMANTTREAVSAFTGLGGYLARILGTVPEDLVGYPPHVRRLIIRRGGLWLASPLWGGFRASPGGSFRAGPRHATIARNTRGLDMNAARLKEIVDLLLDAEALLQLQTKLQTLHTSINSIVSNPTPATRQHKIILRPCLGS